MKQTLTQRMKQIEKHIRQIDVVLDSHGTDLYHLRNSDHKPYTAQASTCKQTTPVCCHCEKEVNKPLTDSKPNKELRNREIEQRLLVLLRQIIIYGEKDATMPSELYEYLRDKIK